MRTPFLSALLCAAAATTTVTACSAPGGDDAAPSTTSAASTELRYEQDAIHIDGIALTQFPGYEPNDVVATPRGWAIRKTLNVGSATDIFGALKVAAVIFQPTSGYEASPAQPMDMVDGASFKATARKTDEGSMAGGGRDCHFRVSTGAMGDDPGLQAVAHGTVVAFGDGKPGLGVWVYGGDEAEITPVIRSIAATICPA